MEGYSMKKIVIVISSLLFSAQSLQSNTLEDVRNAARQCVKPLQALTLEGCSAMVFGAGTGAFLKICVLPVFYGFLEKTMPSSNYLTFSTAVILGLTLIAQQKVNNKKEPYQCPQEWEEEYQTAQKAVTCLGFVVGFNTTLSILSKLI
jgi:hypothetical protein